MIDDDQLTDDFTKVVKVESFLEGLTASTISHKLETKMKRLLEKYRIRKAREDSNKEEVGFVIIQSALRPQSVIYFSGNK